MHYDHHHHFQQYKLKPTNFYNLKIALQLQYQINDKTIKEIKNNTQVKNEKEINIDNENKQNKNNNWLVYMLLLKTNSDH